MGHDVAIVVTKKQPKSRKKDYLRCVKRNMDNERITVRLPKRDLDTIDLLIDVGEFGSRSEVIRHAIHDFVKKQASTVLETAEQIKQVQQLHQELESIGPYLRK